MTAMTTGSQYLWFLSRGSGLVLLVLFSAVIVLGVATRTGSAPPRWPRFAVAELHRTLSLFAVALLVLHVVTAILDPFVTTCSTSRATANSESVRCSSATAKRGQRGGVEPVRVATPSTTTMLNRASRTRPLPLERNQRPCEPVAATALTAIASPQASGAARAGFARPAGE